MQPMVVTHKGFDPFYGTPAVLIVLAKKDWPTHVYDGSLVMGNLTKVSKNSPSSTGGR